VRPDETAFSLSDILEMGLENVRKERHLIGNEPMPQLYSDNGLVLSQNFWPNIDPSTGSNIFLVPPIILRAGESLSGSTGG